MWHNSQWRKKVLDTIIKSKDISFRVWQKKEKNDEYINLLETNTSDTTDFCKNRVADPIFMGSPVFFKNFIYYFLSDRKIYSNLCSMAGKIYSIIDDRISL